MRYTFEFSEYFKPDNQMGATLMMALFSRWHNIESIACSSHLHLKSCSC